MDNTRRDFTKLAAGAALGAAIPAAAKKLDPLTPGIKLALQVQVDFSDVDLTFGKQMGIEYVSAASGGGASARVFQLNKDAKGYWFNPVVGMEEATPHVYEGPFTHGRKYSENEIWENYTYFIRRVAPVAEELGIRIGIHPEDPPVPVLGGVPRCIFGNFDGYVRALEIANSPNIGVCLCCGTWLEGGPVMGKDVVEAARAF